MLCPNCGSEMDAISVRDQHNEKFDIERCIGCGGFWLDKGELKQLTPDKAEEVDVESHAPEEFLRISLNCPRCHIPLSEQHAPHTDKIVLQHCPDCHGYFLRRGQIYDYFKLKWSSLSEPPDDNGMMPKRDRVLTAFSSSLLLIAVTSFLYSMKAGYLDVAADSLYSYEVGLSVTWLLILIAVFVTFALGLVLALFRSHRTLRILGWSLVLFSLMLLGYFTHT